jgi:hypothetical protein
MSQQENYISRKKALEILYLEGFTGKSPGGFSLRNED